MFSRRERNKFYNTNSITKYEINIIRSSFGEARSYGSRFWSICLGNNAYTDPRRDNKENVTPIQGPVLKNDKNSLQKIFLQ